MNEEYLRIHDRIGSSRANGPGKRAVIWLQGCKLRCEGCFNPATHPLNDGEILSISDLYEWVRSIQEIEGITISGGEPFLQADGLTNLLKLIQSNTPLSIIVFTGYSWAEIQSSKSFSECLELIDVLLSGRYQEASVDESAKIGVPDLAFSNKTYHFLTNRYRYSDFCELPESEILVDTCGNIIISGANRINLI